MRIVECDLYLISTLFHKKILENKNSLRHLGYRLICIDNFGDIIDPLLDHKADLTHLELPKNNI